MKPKNFKPAFILSTLHTLLFAAYSYFTVRHNSYFMKPTTWTYQNIYMISIHCYMFHQLTAIVQEPYQY